MQSKWLPRWRVGKSSHHVETPIAIHHQLQRGGKKRGSGGGRNGVKRQQLIRHNLPPLIRHGGKKANTIFSKHFFFGSMQELCVHVEMSSSQYLNGTSHWVLLNGSMKINLCWYYMSYEFFVVMPLGEIRERRPGRHRCDGAEVEQVENSHHRRRRGERIFCIRHSRTSLFFYSSQFFLRLKIFSFYKGQRIGQYLKFGDFKPAARQLS